MVSLEYFPTIKNHISKNIQVFFGPWKGRNYLGGKIQLPENMQL